jgi:peptidoglycan hydrolase CwlO-like protein
MGLAAEPGWYTVRIKTDNWDDDGQPRWKQAFLARTDGTHRAKTSEERLETAKRYASVGTDTSDLEAQIQTLNSELTKARTSAQTLDGRLRNVKTKIANVASDISDD